MEKSAPEYQVPSGHLEHSLSEKSVPITDTYEPAGHLVCLRTLPESSMSVYQPRGASTHTRSLTSEPFSMTNLPFGHVDQFRDRKSVV